MSEAVKPELLTLPSDGVNSRPKIEAALLDAVNNAYPEGNVNRLVALDGLNFVRANPFEKIQAATEISTTNRHPVTQAVIATAFHALAKIPERVRNYGVERAPVRRAARQLPWWLKARASASTPC